MILHKVIRKLVNAYKRNEELLYRRSLHGCGDKSVIMFPAVLGHPEYIDLGEKTTILANGRMQCYPELVEENKAPHIIIGNNCYIGERVTILAGADIIIGNDVLMASNVTIVSENHSTEIGSIPYMSQNLVTAEINIGNNVWIGEKVIILMGVNIGNNVVIGAGSVVNRSVPNNAIVVGNPARVVKVYNDEKKIWERV